MARSLAAGEAATSLGKVLERNISPSVRMYYFANYLCSDVMQMFCTHANTSALSQRVGDAFAK